jgi:hypothetical protein
MRALGLARADTGIDSSVVLQIACRCAAAPGHSRAAPHLQHRAIIDATFAVEQQLVDAGLQVAAPPPLPSPTKLFGV